MVTAKEEVVLDVAWLLCVAFVACVGVYPPLELYPPLEVMERPLLVVVVTKGAPLEVVCVCLVGLGRMWRLWV